MTFARAAFLVSLQVVSLEERGVVGLQEEREGNGVLTVRVLLPTAVEEIGEGPFFGYEGSTPFPLLGTSLLKRSAMRTGQFIPPQSTKHLLPNFTTFNPSSDCWKN